MLGLILLFGTSALAAQSPDSRALEKSPFWAAIRSAVFPGWGQFYTGHYLKGSLFFIVESGLITGALMEDRWMKQAYQRSLSGDREYYDRYLRHLQRRNTYLWWLGGMVVYSMLDAYVDAHLYRFDEEVVSVDLEPSVEKGIKIKLVWYRDF